MILFVQYLLIIQTYYDYNIIVILLIIIRSIPSIISIKSHIKMAQLLQQLLTRAKTFKLTKWHYHNPLTFNPYILASQGYQCTSLNTLQCHICHNTVMFSTPQFQEREQNIIKKQLQNHDNTCQYYGRHAKDIDQGQLYLRMDQLIDATKQSHKQYNISQLPQKQYPLITINKFNEQLHNNSQTQLIKTIYNKYKINSNQPRISFILTCLGWTRKGNQELECAFCGRVVVMKDYIITNQDKQNVNVNVNDMIKAEVNGKQIMDVFAQHRYFCLWVSQHYNGFKVYVQYLYDKLSDSQQLFKNHNPQDMKKIRTLLDGYLQKFQVVVGQSMFKGIKIIDQCSQMIKSIQQKQDVKQHISEDVIRRKKQIKQFLEQVEAQIRMPLKKVKID